MNLLDVNVLIYARRKDVERHQEFRSWLSEALNAGDRIAVSSHTLAAAIRILTNRRVWRDPLSLHECLEYSELVRSSPAVAMLEPGPQHWESFDSLCRAAQADGNLVMDAWLAALAIENDCTLITTDRDFARFPGLRWRHPLAP